MKRARLLHVTPSGLLVASVQGEVREQSLVTDPKGNMVGYVLELFGPVSSPYVLIKPTGGGKTLELDEGTQLFVYPSKQRSKRSELEKGRQRLLLQEGQEPGLQVEVGAQALGDTRQVEAQARGQSA